MSVLNKKPGEEGGPPLVTLEDVTKLIDTRLGAKFDDFKKTGLSDAIRAQVEPVNTQLTTINEALGKLVAGQAPPPQNDGSGNKNQVPPEVNAQLRNLTDQLKSYGNEIQTLKTAKEAAEKRAEETERYSSIRTALNGLPFVSDKSAETAFSIVQPHVRRLDDGSLVAGINGSDFPVDSFVKDFLQKEHGYLFKTTGASGSGAPSSGSSLRMGTKADISSIKIGMKPEERQAAVEAIAAAVATNASS
jgi:hypothetical protein